MDDVDLDVVEKFLRYSLLIRIIELDDNLKGADALGVWPLPFRTQRPIGPTATRLMCHIHSLPTSGITEHLQKGPSYNQ